MRGKRLKRRCQEKINMEGMDEEREKGLERKGECW